MPRVDFYILPGQADRERFTCDLAGKIHRQNHQLYIHTRSQEQARALDDLLWTWKDISFLPHCLVTDDATTDTITIGWEGEPGKGNEVLINLGNSIPEFANNYDRIVEVVAADDTDKQQARDRYKQYRQAGFELHNHEL